MPSQLARVAERSDREKHEQARDGYGHADEPAGYIAGPSAKRGVEPAYGKNGKDRADDFMKKLPQHSPQAAESARGARSAGGVCWRGHKSILAQNTNAPESPRSFLVGP